MNDFSEAGSVYGNSNTRVELIINRRVLTDDALGMNEGIS